MRVPGCDPAVERCNSPDPGVSCEALGLSLPAGPEQDDGTRVVELWGVRRDGVLIAAGENCRRLGTCHTRNPVAVEDEDRDPGPRSQGWQCRPVPGLTRAWLGAGRRRPVDECDDASCSEREDACGKRERAPGKGATE